jgi:hypothetical protein
MPSDSGVRSSQVHGAINSIDVILSDLDESAANPAYDNAASAGARPEARAQVGLCVL